MSRVYLLVLLVVVLVSTRPSCSIFSGMPYFSLLPPYPLYPFFFYTPPEYPPFSSIARMQATCEFINKENAVFRSIPYSGFFDQLCRVAKAFMPTKKDIEAVAKQAEPEATKRHFPRLRRLRERMQQQARTLEKAVKEGKSAPSAKSAPTARKLTRKLR